MGAIGHGQRFYASRARHLEVVRRVADHDGFMLRYVEFRHQFPQHRGVRLGVGLVGAAGGGEKRLQSMKVQVVIEAVPALAGGDGEKMLAGKLGEQLWHAVKKLHRILARQEMAPITLHEGGIALRGQAGNGEPQSVMQAQADDMARAPRVGNFEVELARGVTDAFGDRRRRIDDRAIPVEDDEPVAQGRTSDTKRFMSSGRGDSSFTGSPVSGWRKPSFPAWS